MAQRHEKPARSASEKGFFRSLYSSIGSSSRQDKTLTSSASSSSVGSSNQSASEAEQRLVKHHSFSGAMPFLRSGDDAGSNGGGKHDNGLLSKRPSLIIPFSGGNQQHGDVDGHTTSYLDDFQAPISKSGVLIKQANHFKTWKKRLMVLKGHSLFYYVSGTSGEDTYPRGVIPLLGVKITPIDAARFKRPNCFEICHPGYRPIYLMAKSDADLNVWMSSLTSAAMPTTPDRRMLVITSPIDSLFDTPALEDALPYKRPYYFRQKVAFCVPRPEDKARTSADLFELNERRLTTLCDLNNYCDNVPMILGDPQLYVELLHLVGCYIFRPFARLNSNTPGNIFVEEPSAEDSMGNGHENPLDKYSEYTVEEQQWGMLSACYDLLLKAIEHIDKLEKHVRKEFFQLRFVAQLVNLFKTPSFKERQVLKGVLHRLYYKLTQRRSSIRKEIAHFFYEYIYESSNHYGVAELLEILGSIVNGFACPIKEEHVTLLERALIPLHSTPAFISYHQQLAYCMIQYASKDHALFTPIVRGLLKYWPVGNSFKEVIFIVEFEELLEHVLGESDFDHISRKLARRLGQCMISEQFQVAERAISCWSSPSCLRIMNEYEKLAQSMFDIVKPFLRKAIEQHWNTVIQQRAQETYTLYYNMGYDSDDVTSASTRNDEGDTKFSDKTEESDPDEELGPVAPSSPPNKSDLPVGVRLSASNGKELLDMVVTDDQSEDDEEEVTAIHTVQLQQHKVEIVEVLQGRQPKSLPAAAATTTTKRDPDFWKKENEGGSMKTSPKRMKKKLKRGQKKEKQKCNRNAGTDSNGLCMNNKAFLASREKSMEPGAAASSTLPLLALPSGDTLKFRKRQNDLNEQEEEALRRQLRQHIGAAAVLPSNKQPKPKHRTARDASVCEPLTGNSSSSSSGSIDALDPTSLTALWSSASVWNVSELLKLVQRLLWVSDEDMAEEIDESDPKFIAGKKFLGGVEAFAMLTENELAQLVGLSQFRTFHGGDVVIEDEREADGLYIVLTGTASRFAATNGVIDNDGSPLDTFAYQEHFGSIISPSEAGPTADRMETTVIASSDILECIWLPELVVRMLNIQPRMEYEFVLILNNPPYGADEDAQQTVLLNLLRAGLHVTVLANTRNTRNYVVLLLSAPLWLLAREDKLMVMERIIENHAEEDTRNVGDDYEYHAETMTASDRIAAFASILTRSPSDKPPGAGIRGIEQNQDPIVRDVFPLHDPSMTDFILTSWFTETQPNSLKRLFLLRIKDYFGLRIAFFAAFVRLYNAALVYPSNAGAVLWIFWRWIDYRSYVKAVGIYGLCVAFIWAPSFLKRWRRYQNSLLVEWNLLGTTEVEQPNPEFRDYVVESINVSNDGEPPDYVEVKSYDHRRRWPKYLIFGVFCLLCLVMLFAFVGVYVQWYIIAVMTPMCTNPRCPEYRNIDGGCVDHCQELFAQGKSYLFMSAIDSCADYCNTTAFDTTYYRCDAALVGCFHTERGILGTARWFYVLVQGIVLGLTLDIVFLALFETIAQGFNRWENYPTEQESERRLIEKIFLFNWVGYFYWFFLLAFVYVPNGADVQSLIRKHVDTNRLLTLNDSLKFSRYWIDGLISMDSAFVTPMIVTQALNLVINTFVPYLLRRAIIRARDSYHVKKDRLLQLGKHAPRKLLATAKRAATAGANGATANGGDSVSGVWEDIVDDVPISGYNLFAEDQQDDPTDAWLPVVPPGEDQTMNRHELSHLLAARVPIAARNMERAVHDLFGNLAAHETHMTDICGELTKDDMDMYQLTSFNWLDRVTRKMEDAGHLRDFWDATTGSSDDSSSSQQGKGSSGGSGRHWKIALITSWQCRNYNYTADRILEESSMSTYSPFGDLLHLAIQFSYTIMFSVVWPFCCLCSFCRNAVALRFDAIKMTIDCKRAVPRRTVGIGSWLTAFLFEITIAQIIVPALFVYVSGQFDAFFSDCTISESRYGPAANECLTATQRLVAFCSLENAGVAVCLLVYAKKSAISNETTIKIVAHSRKLRHNLRKSVRMIGESILVSSPPVRIASSSPVGKTESSLSSLLYKQHRDHHHHGDMLDDSEDPSAMFSVDLHPPVGVVGGAMHRRRPHGSGHSSRMDPSSSSLSTSSGLNGDQAREWREGTVSWVKNGRIKVNFSGGRQLSDGAMRGTATQSKNEEVWLTNSESHVLMVPTPVKIFEIGMPVLLASPTRFGRWIEATITRMDNRDRFGVELTAVPNEMHLRVVEAQNLRVSTLRHTSAVLVDPYCVVTVGTYFRHATSTKRRALNPVWDEAVVFPLSARDLYGAPTPGNASGLHQAAAGSGSARTNSRLGSASSSTPPNRAAEVTPTPPPPPAPVRTIKFSVHNNDPLAMNECLGAVELDLQQLRTGGQRHRLLVPLSHKRHRWTLDAIQNVMRKQAMGATDYPVLGMPHLLVELQWIDTRLPSRVLVRAQGESKELELSRKFCETHLCYGIQEGLINQGPISTT